MIITFFDEKADVKHVFDSSSKAGGMCNKPKIKMHCSNVPILQN